MTTLLLGCNWEAEYNQQHTRAIETLTGQEFKSLGLHDLLCEKHDSIKSDYQLEVGLTFFFIH